ncbi:FHA domain-containing protein FhaB/FipA [Kribbia dieselivorans]|uniref:FHA domain-containing protein FhaB/FipA n=1 Tax=Kribbia dieselivorans TaxID=331526 RepID=UPI0008396D66|nr:FHA domain-containing protein [Kribbia dieselivorans]
MSALTLLVLRLGVLLLLWLFVFAIVGVLRSDLYGTRVVARTAVADTGGRRRRRARPTARRATTEPSHLVVTSGSLAGTTLTLKPNGTLIGRNPECTLVLDDDFSSGRHARLFAEGSHWYVEDLGSTNGTFLGSQQVTGPTQVHIGSSIRVGRTVLELRK